VVVVAADEAIDLKVGKKNFHASKLDKFCETRKLHQLTFISIQLCVVAAQRKSAQQCQTLCNISLNPPCIAY